MGIARWAAHCSMIEGVRRPFQGSVLQLGRQDIYFGVPQLEAWAAQRGFTLNRRRPPTFSGRPLVPQVQCIDDATWFSWLGFDQVQSCDSSAHEGANHIFDLNVPSPPQLTGQFDMIVDGGTMEHTFHVPQVLANIHDMLAAGGRVMHMSPVSNYVDHGFYMFSPTLFWDYYSSNGYEVNAAGVVGHTQDPMAESALFRYVPGSIEQLSSSGGFSPENFGKYNMFMFFFVATKSNGSTSGVIPSQYRYRRIWGQINPGSQADLSSQFQFLGLI